jgi:GT2 family glycosyltransferase
MLYIITVNYNAWRDTVEFLESLGKGSFQAFRVILCDNASKDASLENLQNWVRTNSSHTSIAIENKLAAYSPIVNVKTDLDSQYIDSISIAGKYVTIGLNRNIGFAAANNVGIRFGILQGDAECFFCLNNDTVVASDAIKELNDKNREYRRLGIKVGIIAPKVLLYSKDNVLQGIGGIYNRFSGISRLLGGGEIDNGQYDNEESNRNIDSVIGAAMFIPVEFINDVGLMSEEYFLYLEENDWCERGFKKGWTLGYCWKAKIFHKVGRSIGTSDDGRKRSKLSDYYGLKNRLVFSRKYYPLYFPFVVLGFVVVLFNRLSRGQFDRAKMIFAIIFEVVFNIKSRNTVFY